MASAARHMLGRPSRHLLGAVRATSRPPEPCCRQLGFALHVDRRSGHAFEGRSVSDSVHQSVLLCSASNLSAKFCNSCTGTKRPVTDANRAQIATGNHLIDGGPPEAECALCLSDADEDRSDDGFGIGHGHRSYQLGLESLRA